MALILNVRRIQICIRIEGHLSRTSDSFDINITKIGLDWLMDTQACVMMDKKNIFIQIPHAAGDHPLQGIV